MNHIPKSQRGMPSEHNTWLLEVIAEVSMDAGIMFQFVCLNELKRKSRHYNFSCLCAQCVYLYEIINILQFISNSLQSPFLHIFHQFSHDCPKEYGARCSLFFGTSSMATERKRCKHSLLRASWRELSAQLPHSK